MANHRVPTGKVYSDIMRDSGISLAEGKYVTAASLTSSLQQRGVRGSDLVFLKDLTTAYFSNGYGREGGIWNGFTTLHDKSHPQIDKARKKGIWLSPEATFFYNGWSELTPLFSERGFHVKDHKGVNAKLHKNPREGAEILQEVYGRFADVPEGLRNEFFALAGSREGYLHGNYVIYDPETPGGKLAEMLREMDVNPPKNFAEKLKRVYQAILNGVSQEHKADVAYVMHQLVQNTFGPGKIEIVQSQLDDLVGFDTSTMPLEWSEGSLTDEAVTRNHIGRLNDLFRKRVEPRF